MSDDLFRTTADSRLGGRTRRALVLPLSIAAHGIVFALLAILSLAGIDLPSIARPVQVVLMAATLPDPPAAPVPARTAAMQRAAELVAHAAPVVPPASIGNEILIDFDPADEVRGQPNVPGGVPNGVVIGVTLDAPPPAPANPPPLPRAGGQIQFPRRIGGKPPAYPDVARQARIEGVVVIDAVIDVTGRVTDVRVLQGHPLLEQAALEAVRTWVYEPSRLNGVPTAVMMTLRVTFTLRQ